MKRLTLLAAPLFFVGCVSFSVRHAPGYQETAAMKKESFSPVVQVCTHLCDLEGPRGRIEFGDFSYNRIKKDQYLLREHTSFSIHYNGAAATCKGEGKSPLQCTIDVPGRAASQLALDPGCSTGRLDDGAATPLRVELGSITAHRWTTAGMDLSMADERGIAIFGQMGAKEGIDVLTRQSDSATPAQVLGVAAIYAFIKMRPNGPSECLIESSAVATPVP